MAYVEFKRGDTATMEDTSITDGLVFFNTEEKQIYMDNGTDRSAYGGATDLVDTIAEATDDTAFTSNAVVDLFPQKSTVVDTASTALAVTEQHVPLGCLAFAEEVGTKDISAIGDGTITGALVDLNSRLTLNYDDTSYSGQQDINSTLQAILEQVFPSVLNLNDKSSADWTQATGISGSFTSFNPLKCSNFARIDYNNLIDYSKYNKIVYSVSKSSTDNLLILAKDDAIPTTTITGSGIISGEIDISSITVNASIGIQSMGGNVQFYTFELQ